MKTPHSAFYRYTAEAVAAANKIAVGCVNEQSHKYGMENAEPLIVAADCMLKYAQAYRQRYENGLANDFALSESFAHILGGLKALMDADGAVALFKDITTDTKDNGAVCDILLAACKAGGFDWEDI